MRNLLESFVNRNTWLFLITLGFMVFLFTSSYADEHKYTDSWGKEGYTLEQQSPTKAIINYSINNFSISDFQANGESMKTLELAGHFLPNDEGAPNLPGAGRYLAIPQGADAEINILSYRTETFTNVYLSPAPRIPWDTETDPLDYRKDEAIYTANKFYPENPIKLSDKDVIRGVDVVMLGITPFHYNPVTRQLIVYRDIKIEVTFSGGTDHFGDDRLRSYWWDPLFSDMLLNFESLPKVDYSRSFQATEDVGCEYLIITPDNADFLQWADSIKRFRTLQGIKTDIKTISEVGGNNANTIENYINNAFNTWDIVPAACLLIGDYGTSGNTITSPIWDSYCVSDNIYADVSNNDMPDIVFARMTAQNVAQLEVMVTKFLDYERTPPTNANFYHHPISALGWQDDRWFQICSEVVGGFWNNELGKETVRINALGSPSGNHNTGPWSTNSNTPIVMNYFGPSGLGYIPATPQELGGFTGGTAAMVNNAINSGSFMLQHRDHGYEQGWGEPDYSSGDINGLNNTDLCFVWSINCLTGKYNISSEVFAEKFHRYTYNGENSGALAVNAASEVSYSFVNDTYVWGAFDNMWPEFMPDYGSTPEPRGILPAFASAAGKYFLQASSWPYNTSNKEVTYNLFHHHGDAFSVVYSEVPQELTVEHNPILYAGFTNFEVNANENAFIALTVNGEIIATAIGTGDPVSISIPGQIPPDQMLVTVTLQDYFRYESLVEVIPPTGPYVVRESYIINDETGGNNDGLLDYGETNMLSLSVENVGVEQADNVTVTISTDDEFVTITDDNEVYGNIPANTTMVVDDGFAYEVTNDLPDGHSVSFEVTATDGTDIWVSYFSITGHAPVLEFVEFMIEDPAGNNNGKIEPGETVDITINIENTGSSEAFSIMGELTTMDMYLNINTSEFDYGNLIGGATMSGTFSATADFSTPAGHLADLTFEMEADLGITGAGAFEVVIGQIPILILDLDENGNSAPQMEDAISEVEIAYEKLTSFPPDLNLYSNIFLCLGIYSDNHVLTSSEGQILTEYLENGGNLYMEGGDTWYYDNQTAVHAMFNINPTADGSGNMGQVVGQSGTFTEGMSFNYSGENSYMDHIDPVSPAVMILENQSPNYGTGVAYDEGSYRTIGTSHEFGGLDDDVSPSTKTELMEAYLDFLGISMSIQALFSSNTSDACTDESIEFYDQSTGGAVSWEWTFEGGTPSTSTDQNPVVVYSSTGVFDVTLEVSDGSETSSITLEEYITISETPEQAATPVGDDEICTNFMLETDYTTDGIATAESYVWEVLPVEAGSISGTGMTGTVEWVQNWEGSATIKVKGINDCGDGDFSEEFSVMCSICTGINEISENANIQVYPNPNNGNFTIKLELEEKEAINFKIFSALNKVVFEEKSLAIESDYSKTINLSMFASGIYYLQITGENTSLVKKIIIQN